jgi:hypothetical protein
MWMREVQKNFAAIENMVAFSRSAPPGYMGRAA